MGGVFAVLIIAFLGVLALVYLVARVMSARYEQGYREYETLENEIPKIIGRVHRDADRWPIYSRPILFRDVDHKVQVEFSQLHKTIDEIDTIVPQIKDITLPLYPERVYPIFALPENVKTILESFRFLGLINDVAYKILAILDFTKNVNAFVHDESIAKRSVISSTKDLLTRLQVAQKKLESNEWGNTNIDHISWTLLTTQQCHDTARERVKLPSGDGLEYAIAYIYTRIGNASLDYYDLYTNGLEEAKRYELDLFAKILRDSHRHLEMILENEDFSTLRINDLGNWRKLRIAEEQIDAFPSKLLEAEKSLSLFRNERDKFEILEQQLVSLDIDQEIAVAYKVEEECTYYWYSYQEKKQVWQSVIGESKLPREILSQLKSELISSITPFIKSPVIKQSLLQNTINKFEVFYNQLEIGKKNTEKLLIELNRHKNAQKQVEKLLNIETGGAGAAFKQLETIVENTDPDIKGSAIAVLHTFRTYVDRANIIRGANFPVLEVELQELIKNANELLGMHSELLVKLEAICVQQSREITNSLKDVSEIRFLTPTVDDEISNQFVLLEKEGRQLVNHFNPKSGYEELNAASTLMDAWLKEVERYLDPAKALRSAFTEIRDEAIAQLRATQNQIEQERHNLQYKWGWVKSAMSPEIEMTQKKLDVEFKNWNRHEGRKWAEMYLRSAIEYCEKVISRCNDIFNDMNSAIAGINKEQRKLQEKENAIRRIANKNLYRILESDIADVLILCDLAKDADTLPMVEITLKRAEQIVTNAATPQERQQAQMIIDTGGGSVVLGPVYTSGGDFIGRDKLG